MPTSTYTYALSGTVVVILISGLTNFSSAPAETYTCIYMYVAECIYAYRVMTWRVTIVLQIRAEEVSKTQYLLEMKFSAQGLDKKVCSLLPLQMHQRLQKGVYCVCKYACTIWGEIALAGNILGLPVLHESLCMCSS